MTLPQSLAVARGILVDTVSQSRAAGITTALVLATLLAFVFCLGVSIVGETPPLETRPWENPEVLPASEAQRLGLGPDGVRNEGVDVPTGHLSLFFGAVQVPLTRTGAHAVRLIQVILAAGVADTLGVLLALLWTAGFVPAMLEPAAASVAFSKPVSRGRMLVGKFVGVVAAVGGFAFVFVAATWLALGIRTGIWDVRYFLAVPVLVVHFGTFFAVSTWIAVWTRSAVAAALGTLVFWALCSTINVARLDALAGGSGIPAWLEALYWPLPKPIDGHLLLASAMSTEESLRGAYDIRKITDLGYTPEIAILAALPFTIIVLWRAARKLARIDY